MLRLNKNTYIMLLFNFSPTVSSLISTFSQPTPVKNTIPQQLPSNQRPLGSSLKNSCTQSPKKAPSHHHYTNNNNSSNLASNFAHRGPSATRVSARCNSGRRLYISDATRGLYRLSLSLAAVSVWALPQSLYVYQGVSAA